MEGLLFPEGLSMDGLLLPEGLSAIDGLLFPDGLSIDGLLPVEGLLIEGLLPPFEGRLTDGLAAPPPPPDGLSPLWARTSVVVIPLVNKTAPAMTNDLNHELFIYFQFLVV